nr:solute carrier family 22 member 21 isoform X1 [Ciona intestinalis]|eukprot:XP_009858916.2 solute carrier family 22 member 21 isoform X1 [Ciona intestinalis]
MIHFNLILEKFNGIGKSQFVLFFMVAYYNISKGLNAVATVFIAYSPQKRCNVPPLDDSALYPNLTESDILNYTIPYDAVTEKYDNCMRYSFNLSKCNVDLACVNQTYPAISCDHGYQYDRTIFTETVITEFDLVCDQNYLNALSTSLFYVGMLVGSIVFGNSADRFGRKPVMITSFVFVLGCMLGVSLSTSVEMYMLFRTSTAIFLSGSNVGSFVYAMEILPQKWIGIFGVIYQGICTIGYMVLSAIAYEWRDWREIMLASTAVSSPFMLFALIIPESPRWQFTNGIDKEAIKTTKNMAKWNGVVLTQEDWDRATKNADKNITIPKKYSSLDLFKTPGIRLVATKAMFVWFSTTALFYGLVLNTGALAGDVFVNNVLGGVAGMSSMILCMLLMNRIGRRKLICSLLIIGSSCLLLSVVINQYKKANSGLETLSLAFAFAGRFGITGATEVMYPFIAEVFPTVIRGNGVGIASSCSRIGGILAPFVISLQHYLTWLPDVVFAGLALMAGLVSLTLPETNGCGLMETIEEAEIFYKNRRFKDSSSDGMVADVETLDNEVRNDLIESADTSVL